MFRPRCNPNRCCANTSVTSVGCLRSGWPWVARCCCRKVLWVEGRIFLLFINHVLVHVQSVVHVQSFKNRYFNTCTRRKLHLQPYETGAAVESGVRNEVNLVVVEFKSGQGRKVTEDVGVRELEVVAFHVAEEKCKKSQTNTRTCSRKIIVHNYMINIFTSRKCS